MAWTEILDTDDFSFGYAVQSSGLNTAGTSFVWLDALMPQVTSEVGRVESKRARQSRGAGSRPSVGHVWYTIAVRMKMHGQPDDYDHTTDSPALVGGWKFLEALGGQALVAYAATSLSAAADAKTLTLSGQAKLGCLLATAGPSGLVNAMGWVKTITGVGPYDHGLQEDVAALPVLGSDRVPTLTLFPGSTQPSPLTLRVTGGDASQDIRFLGCYLQQLTIAPDQDDVLWGDFTLRCYGGKVEDSSGGLQTVDGMLALRPMLARGGARIVLASNVLTSLSDGTADPSGTCDVRDLQLSWSFKHYVVRCGSGNEGVGDCIVRAPTVRASFSVPKISDFYDGGENIFERAQLEETDLSFSLYLGNTPGRLFAFRMPAGMVMEWPDWTGKDEGIHLPVVLEAGHYAGDGASTDAGNKTSAIALG